MVSPEHDARLAKAQRFLRSNVGKQCEDCGSAIESAGGPTTIPSEPFSHTLLKHLHAFCANSKCGASYCRGCFASATLSCRSEPPSSPPTSSTSTSPPGSRSTSTSPPRNSPPAPSGAPQGCRGSRGCDIKSCCVFAPVVAVSSILDAFDAECIKAAANIGSDLTSPTASLNAAQNFVRAVISRSGASSTRSFESVIIRTLHSISSWLVVFRERREEADDDEEAEQGEEAKDLLRAFVGRSLILPVVHAFLQNGDVGDWLKHSEIYVLILEVLRRFVENGLSSVLGEPIVLPGADDEEIQASEAYRWKREVRSRTREAHTSESSATSSEAELDFTSDSDGEETETDATSSNGASSDSKDDGSDDGEDRSTRHPSEHAQAKFAARSSAREESAVPTIKTLVTRLEAHRGPLMAYGATVKFAASKAKVNALCDGIWYLLLQQLVGWD